MSVIITADSSCDLPAHIISPVPFERIPLTIIQMGTEYKDGIDLSPEEIYARVEADAPVPTTSAINIADYEACFSRLRSQYDAIIHISLGSGISSCNNNAVIAAKSFSNVYIVDSQNISMGSALLVLEARRMIQEGMEPAAIAPILEEMATRVEFYFLIDQLTYLQKGGRCSSLAALGANLLRLKPCIAVGVGGSLYMAKKYRGIFEKVIPSFFRDHLRGRTDILPEKTLLVTTHCPSHWVTLAVNEIQMNCGHKVDHVYHAGCTICSHSGPRAMGLAILRK